MSFKYSRTGSLAETSSPATPGDDARNVLEHYAPGMESDRLITPLGSVEFERTKEVVTRYLPPPPARVADIGGGPGRYALWLAEAGYRVVHRDLVPTHVDELREAASDGRLAIETAVGDARDLSLPDASADAVLLLGPLYHLTARTDRLRALREARRILRPGGVGFVAAISRWAPRLQAVVVERLYRQFGVELLREELSRVERTGMMPPLQPKGFAGFVGPALVLALSAIETRIDDGLALLANAHGGTAASLWSWISQRDYWRRPALVDRLSVCSRRLADNRCGRQRPLGALPESAESTKRIRPWGRSLHRRAAGHSRQGERTPRRRASCNRLDGGITPRGGATTEISGNP
jgi:SAM-dependent methyltransferase